MKFRAQTTHRSKRSKTLHLPIQSLEPRLLMAFTNWSAIQPAIALVPASAGQLTSATVVNFGTTVYTGPLNVSNTLNRIRADDGPDRSDDGIVYTDPQGSGLPVDGTYYEFTVESADGTDQNFTSSFTDPGPMRLLLASGGDCYFTGDHYSTFDPVYIYSAQSSPTIGSLTVNPTSVTIGTSATLTAGNVSETGGTISSVGFYSETNGTSGLQIGSDTLIGNGIANGSNWSINVSTSGLTAGTYTYYAVATDSSGTASSTATTTLSVTSVVVGTPIIGEFAIMPATANTGAGITLTASNVTESNGSIGSVSFYRETNGVTGLQIGSDMLVGSGLASGTTWTLATSTTGLAAGNYTYYAVATDAGSVNSAAVSATVVLTTATSAGVLASWDVNGQTGFGTQGLAALSTATGVTASMGLTRGSGVSTGGTAAANAWGGSNWASTSALGISGNDFLTFGITVAAGYTASLSSIDLNYRHSTTGPVNGYWQYQLNNGTWALVADVTSEFPSTNSNGNAITELSLTAIAPLQKAPAGSVINLRLVPYASTSTGGTWYVYNITGSDLVINGAAVLAATPLMLNGPANYLKLESDAQHVDIWNNSTATGTPQQMLLSQISTMSFAGTAANDSLTVDFSAGDPLVSGGLTYAGGAGSSSLTLIGTTGNDTIAVSSTAVSVGSAAIAFSGSPMITINPDGGSDSLSLTNYNASLTAPAIGGGILARMFSTLSIGQSSVLNVPSDTVAGTLEHADRAVLVVNSLTDSGTIDLGDNDMVIHGGNLSYVNGLAKAGYNTGFNAGSWNGTGIASTTAGSDTTHRTSIAAILNSANGSPNGSAPLYGSATALGLFDGIAPQITDVLVKFTYVGDANLNGAVDGSDYSRIDAGLVAKSTGWFNGDFNYDGVIDGSDYTLIDNAFNAQGASLAAQTASPAAQVATAKPASRPVVAPPQSAATETDFEQLKKKRLLLPLF